MKLYVASSWRNDFQGGVVQALRNAGHEVYDFKNPEPGDNGFQWSDIEVAWLAWDASRFREALRHPIADLGFAKDWNAMQWAEAGVLVLPCGRSAHLEAGYFVGAKKPLIILLLGNNEPELMYKMANAICLNVDEVIAALAAKEMFAPEGAGMDTLVQALACSGRSEFTFDELVACAQEQHCFEWLTSIELSQRSNAALGKMFADASGQQFRVKDGLLVRFAARGHNRSRRYIVEGGAS